MNPNDKSTEKRNDNATKTIEEPIAEVSDQNAEAVAGGGGRRFIDPNVDASGSEAI